LYASFVHVPAALSVMQYSMPPPFVHSVAMAVHVSVPGGDTGGDTGFDSEAGPPSLLLMLVEASLLLPPSPSSSELVERSSSEVGDSSAR
jgi:hypothetical protein